MPSVPVSGKVSDSFSSSSSASRGNQITIKFASALFQPTTTNTFVTGNTTNTVTVKVENKLTKPQFLKDFYAAVNDTRIPCSPINNHPIKLPV